MYSNFIFNIKSTINTIKTKKTVMYIVAISSCYESSITIFTFYWAPLLTSLTVYSDQDENKIIPYELIYSSMVISTMIGKY